MKSIHPITIITLIPLLCINTFTLCFIIPNKRITKLHSSNAILTTTKLNSKKERRTRSENQNRMLQSIEKQIDQSSTIDVTTLPDGTPNEDPLSPFVLSIVKEADKRKGENIRALRVSKISTLCSFLVFVSGNSKPQNQAIGQAIQDVAEEEYGRIILKEGDAASGWILLDYGDVMVHIMTPRSRLFYDLEGKWKNGEEMDLSGVLIPNDIIGASKDLGGSTGFDEDDDPFWS